MGSREPRNLRFSVTRDKYANFLVGECRLINFDIVKQIATLNNVATMSDAWECISRQPAASVALCIREAKVPIGRL